VPRESGIRSFPPDAEDRRRALRETGFVLACLAAWIAGDQAGIGKVWLLPAFAIALLGYGLATARGGRESWRDFGFRGDNLGASLLPVGAWTLLAAVLLAIWGTGHGRSLASPGIALLLPLYPLHGLAQQFFFQGILNRRLTTLLGRPIPAAFATATAFALVHFGNPVLMALTFPAGLVWSLLYQRRPNLWMLGLSHGILAALAYPLVLGENPLAGG